MRGWTATLFLALGCTPKAPTPPTPKAVATRAAPSGAGAAGPVKAPASAAKAPATVAPKSAPAAAPASTAPTVDPREARAASKCSKLVTAVTLNEDKLSAFPKVAPAFAAVHDGGLVWICPGAHAVKATLALTGRSNVTVAGKDALVLAVEDKLVLRIDGGAQITLRGVGFGHATPVGACGSDVVQAKGVQGLTVRGVGLHGSGVVGLALEDAPGAVVEDSLFVACQTGLTAKGPKPTTRRNRFVQNDRHLGEGLAAGEGDRLGALRTNPASPDPAPMTPDPLASAPPVPLIEALGKRWAVLHGELFTELDGAACGRDAETRACTKALPAKGPTPEHAAAKAKAVTVVGAAGPCTATLGPLRRLEHRGCEPSVFTVREVQGCPGTVAPLAFTGPDAAVAKGLRWVGREGVSTRKVKAPPELQAWIRAVMADDVLSEAIVDASPGGEWVAVRWWADAGKERLVSHGLGLQIDLGDCHVTERTRTAAWLGDAAFELHGDLVTWTPWVGVLAREGRIWGVASRGATLTQLHLRQGEGLKAAWEGYHSADHDECLAGWGPIAFEYPCGP